MATLEQLRDGRQMGYINTPPAAATGITSLNGEVGPAVSVTAGTGVSILAAANTVQVTNTDPGSSVTLANAGGTESLVQDGTGPTLLTKGLTAGAGITLAGAANDVTIGAVLRSNGSFYISTPSSFTPVGLGTVEKIPGTTTSLVLTDFTMPTSNRLTYTGAETRDFIVSVAYSQSVAGGAVVLATYLGLNGVPIPGSRIDSEVANAGEPNSGALNWALSLAQNDFLEVMVEPQVGTNDITYNFLQVVVVVA